MPGIAALLAFLPAFVEYMVVLLQMASRLTESILTHGENQLRNSLKAEPPAAGPGRPRPPPVLAEALEAAFLAMHEMAAHYAARRDAAETETFTDAPCFSSGRRLCRRGSCRRRPT